MRIRWFSNLSVGRKIGLVILLFSLGTILQTVLSTRDILGLARNAEVIFKTLPPGAGQETARQALEASQATAHAAVVGTAIGLPVTLIVCIFFGWLMANGVLGAIRTFQQSLTQVAQGDL